MKYTQPKFTLPACPANVTQAEWDRIFGDSDESWQASEALLIAQVACPICGSIEAHTHDVLIHRHGPNSQPAIDGEKCNASKEKASLSGNKVTKL
jgi:hypothetical protein